MAAGLIRTAWSEVFDGIRDARESLRGTIHDIFAQEEAATPVCPGCEREWQVPRDVAYRLVSCVPDHIKPQTQETVVAFQTSDSHTRAPTICPAVFENIRYTHRHKSRKHRLVEHFQYDKHSGAISYDIENGERQYARIVTLNSWYKTLFSAVLFVSLTVQDLQSNLMLCASLLGMGGVGETFPTTRYTFPALWCLSLVITLAIAVRESLWEWDVKASPTVGDLIATCHRFDVSSTYFALVAFRFFGVETQVKDIVIMLHPWKSVQPFAAFKCENHRAYIIGYPNESLFRVDNSPGAKLGLPVQLIFKTLLFCLKLYMCAYHFDLTLLTACVSSVASVSWGWVKLFRFLRHRRLCKQWMVSVLRSERGDAKQRQAVEKLLAFHYKQRMDCEGNLSPLSRNMYRHSATNSGVCSKCGRADTAGDARPTAFSALGAATVPDAAKEVPPGTVVPHLMVSGTCYWDTAGEDTARRETGAGLVPVGAVEVRTPDPATPGVLPVSLTVPAPVWVAIQDDARRGTQACALLLHHAGSTALLDSDGAESGCSRSLEDPDEGGVRRLPSDISGDAAGASAVPRAGFPGTLSVPIAPGSMSEATATQATPGSPAAPVAVPRCFFHPVIPESRSSSAVPGAVLDDSDIGECSSAGTPVTASKTDSEAQPPRKKWARKPPMLHERAFSWDEVMEVHRSHSVMG